MSTRAERNSSETTLQNFDNDLDEAEENIIENKLIHSLKLFENETDKNTSTYNLNNKNSENNMKLTRADTKEIISDKRNMYMQELNVLMRHRDSLKDLNEKMRDLTSGMQAEIDSVLDQIPESGEVTNSNLQQVSQTDVSGKTSNWKNVNIQTVKNGKVVSYQKSFKNLKNSDDEPFSNKIQRRGTVAMNKNGEIGSKLNGLNEPGQFSNNNNFIPTSLVYPIDKQVPSFVETLPSKIVAIKDQVPYLFQQADNINNKENDKNDNNENHLGGDLLLNNDGSLPVNSVLKHFFNIVQDAETYVGSYFKEDGFYRNLIFTENLFDKDNDELAMNNAVINVNVYMKPKRKGRKEEEMEDEDVQTDLLNKAHIKPGHVKVTVNNDYESNEENEVANKTENKVYSDLQ